MKIRSLTVNFIFLGDKELLIISVVLLFLGVNGLIWLITFELIRRDAPPTIIHYEVHFHGNVPEIEHMRPPKIPYKKVDIRV